MPATEIVVEPTDDGLPDRKARTEKLGFIAWVAIAWLVGLALAAIFASKLPIPKSTEAFPAFARKGPSSGHILGSDAIGRDVLSRLIYGTRTSFAVGFGSIAFGMLIGGGMGLITGYFRGAADSILTPLMNVLLAIPQFVLALSLVTVLATGPGVTSNERLLVVILGLGIVSIPLLGRITRANTLAWSEREFVLAAKAMGAKNSRIMFRDVLPNVIPAMLAIALLGVGIAIVAEGGLALFGVGVQLPTASWGNMISEGQSQMRRAPHIVMFASLVLLVTVMALNYLGDVLTRRFGVKESVL